MQESLAACWVFSISPISRVLGLPLKIPENCSFWQPVCINTELPGADTIFFQNDENMRFFEPHHMMPKNSLVCLLPGSGVNLQAYPELPYSPGDVVHFLFVARLLKEKGIELYLSAAKRVAQKSPECNVPYLWRL